MNDSSLPFWIVRIPTPIWLVLLVLAALAIDWPLQLPAILQHRPTGVALIVAGIALSGWARLTFRRQGAEIFPWSDAHSILVASGPFRFSRNPMYLGLVIVGLGAALVAGTWLMWLAPVVLFALDNFVIIPHEERSMQRTFGESYAAYRVRVRRWI